MMMSGNSCNEGLRPAKRNVDPNFIGQTGDRFNIAVRDVQTAVLNDDAIPAPLNRTERSVLGLRCEINTNRKHRTMI